LPEDSGAIPIELDEVELVEPSYPGVTAPAPPANDRARLLRLYIEQKIARLGADDFFALLDLPKTASAAEVDAAYTHVVNTLSGKRLAEHGLGELAPLAREILDRAREAREVLTHPQRRASYETSIHVSDEKDRAEAQLQAVLQADLEYQH